MFGAQLIAGIAALAMLIGQGVDTAARSAERQVGVVKAVNASVAEVVLTLNDGSEKRIVLAPDASIVRVAPGEKDLSKAAPITLAEVESGDRVLVRGATNNAGALVATKVVVMSKSDLARKHEADRAEWRRRGVSGKVTGINPSVPEITVTTTGRMPETLTVRLAASAIQRRYRPDSARFSDAVPSKIDEIKVGDQIHALGDRNPQESIITAEQIVSGSFRNFAAVVTSVNPAQHTITVKDVDGKKPVIVYVGSDSVLRKLTPEVAVRMANGRPGRPGGGMPPATQNAPQRPEAPAMQSGREPMRMQMILDRMPTFTLEELKSGDALIICSAGTATAEKTTAFTILAGAEPLLERPMEAQRELLGSWDLNTEPNLP
ncbi:MAG TPA: hypothetical protein VD837_00810 [Terriglobales bacterium]|nr:hypothetical protein [Terriglobales bacterium]